MNIQAPEPIVIPPTPEKVYPNLWIYSLSIIAPTTDSGRIQAEFLPFNYANEEIGPSDGKIAISTDKLWQAIQEVPEVAQAFTAIMNCASPLMNWIATQNQPEEISNE